MDVWEQVKQSLASRLSSESYQNWVGRTALQKIEGNRLYIAVPNEATKEWLETEYPDVVQGALRELQLPYQQIQYEPMPMVGASLNAPRNGDMGGFNSASGVEGLFSSPVSQLNPRFRFETFVVGTCNQFAHAAAKAVATTPARKYNPLFIYGGVGMGKTHLMHAIGRKLLEDHPGIRIVYTSSEKFMNQMINCIKLDRMPQFHQHYRQADVLLVDDIQIIAGKERTQEEFFHTFNELYEHSKQIVISSDTPPKQIPGLVDRLRSRFEWGLMADVQPPDLETKMAILYKMADQDGVELPEDVCVFIATKTRSNVRELAGALTKLLAYTSLHDVPATCSVAQQVLRHLVETNEKRVTIDAVVRSVAERFSMQPSQLKLKSNTQQIAYPRQIAMYLAKELTAASLPEIGRAFGGKHHTTVLHSIQKIEQLRQSNPDLNRMLHSLTDSLS